MSYHCPTCGQNLEGRWPKISGVAGGLGLGLFVLLFPFVFRQYICPEHGRIDSENLAPTERRTMLALSLLWFAFAFAILIGLGYLVSDLF